MARILILEWMSFACPLFLLITYHISIPYFKNTPFWRRSIATSFRGLSVYNVMGYIFYLVTVTYSFLFSTLTHLAHLPPVIYHLPLSS